MKQVFFKEFFAGFIRTHAISRHFRRLAILDSLKGTTIARDVPSVLNRTLNSAVGARQHYYNGLCDIGVLPVCRACVSCVYFCVFCCNLFPVLHEAGVGFGVTLYIVNLYGFTAIFPRFAQARGWITLIVHAVFGVTAISVYRWLDVNSARSRPDGH